MIATPLIAYGIMTGTIDESFIFILIWTALADSLIWATIAYNFRDLWTKPRYRFRGTQK